MSADASADASAGASADASGDAPSAPTRDAKRTERATEAERITAADKRGKHTQVKAPQIMAAEAKASHEALMNKGRADSQ